MSQERDSNGRENVQALGALPTMPRIHNVWRGKESDLYRNSAVRHAPSVQIKTPTRAKSPLSGESGPRSPSRGGRLPDRWSNQLSFAVSTTTTINGTIAVEWPFLRSPFAVSAITTSMVLTAKSDRVLSVVLWGGFGVYPS